MRKLLLRAASVVFVASVSSTVQAETFYGYCTDSEHSNVISSFFTYEGSSSDYDELQDKWEAAVSAKYGWEEYQIGGRCYASTDRAKAEGHYNNILSYTDEYLVEFAPVADRPSRPSTTVAKSDDAPKDTHKAEPGEPKKSVADEAAKRRADREAEFQKKQAEYERQLAEQQKQVEEYKRAQEEVARKKEAQSLAAQQALDAHRKEMEANAALVRQHEADVAKYEQEVAAQKLRSDWDKRHGFKPASTDDDANTCVTRGALQSDVSFKGNTAASIVNGCARPVDVRICLMTESKGWNCGSQSGVAPQASWSFSSFNATGEVFVDARIAGANRPLASPN